MKTHKRTFDAPEGASARRTRGAQGFAEVEYLVLVICVGIVTAIALYRLGPAIWTNYQNQETSILEKGP